MKISKIDDYKGGWFVGDFEPTALKTKQFEIGTKVHRKDEKWDVHYHKLATEITYLVKGKMIIQDKMLVSGDVFVIEPYEIADPTFLEDCTVMVIKIPSVPGDKYVVKVEDK